MRQHIKGFVSFVREQGIVGLAIGFILGGSVSKVVASLVTDIIQPVIGFILGSTKGLQSLHYESIMYGNFIATFIDFVIIAAVVYIVFKQLKLEKLDLKKEIQVVSSPEPKAK